VSTNKFNSPAYDQRVINQSVNQSLDELMSSIKEYWAFPNIKQSRNSSLPDIRTNDIFDPKASEISDINYSKSKYTNPKFEVSNRNSLNYLKLRNDKGLISPNVPFVHSQKASKKQNSRLAEYSNNVQLFRAGGKLKPKNMNLKTLKESIERCKLEWLLCRKVHKGRQSGANVRGTPHS